MYNSIMFHCEFYDILQNCCRLSPHVSILVSGVVVQPLHKQNFHFKNLNIYRTLIISDYWSLIYMLQVVKVLW